MRIFSLDQISGRIFCEYSTRTLISAALGRGIEVDLLDEALQIIRLIRGSKREWVKQATHTSRDSHIVFNMLLHKHLTKRVLQESGIVTAKWKLYERLSEYRDAHLRFGDGRAVVKPTDLNGGTGIVFLDEQASPEQWKRAFSEVLPYSGKILVEAFVEGGDYRFLVINGEVVAVATRLPANVLGDGVHTVEELIARKNADPRRGTRADTPLCPIVVDKTVEDDLACRNMNLQSIAPESEMIFLRSVANISGGGDSIDVTDNVHSDYFDIAVEAASLFQSSIVGVDILLENPQQAASPSNHSVIELNANPALAIHTDPYLGKPRPVAESVLDMLGFD